MRGLAVITPEAAAEYQRALATIQRLEPLIKDALKDRRRQTASVWVSPSGTPSSSVWDGTFQVWNGDTNSWDGTAEDCKIREANAGDLTAGDVYLGRLVGEASGLPLVEVVGGSSSGSSDCTEYDDLDPRDCLAAYVQAGVGRCSGVAGGQNLCLVYDCTAHAWLSVGTVATDTGTWQIKVLPPECASDGTRTPVRMVLVAVGGSASGVTSPICGAPQGCRTVDGIKYKVFSFGGTLLCDGARTPCGPNSFAIWLKCGACGDGADDPDNPCPVTVPLCAGGTATDRVAPRMVVSVADIDCAGSTSAASAAEAIGGSPFVATYDPSIGAWIGLVYDNGSGFQMFGRVTVCLNDDGTGQADVFFFDNAGGHGGGSIPITYPPFAGTGTYNWSNGGVGPCSLALTLSAVADDADPCPAGSDTGAKWYCVRITSASHSGSGSSLTCQSVGDVDCLQISNPDTFTGFTATSGDETCTYTAEIIGGPYDTDVECGGVCA